MLYTLLINGTSYYNHYHFATLNQLFTKMDSLIEEYGEEYVTFSLDGENSPTNSEDYVLTIFIGHELVCPVSAGGGWSAYDEWKNSEADIDYTIELLLFL